MITNKSNVLHDTDVSKLRLSQYIKIFCLLKLCFATAIHYFMQQKIAVIFEI